VRETRGTGLGLAIVRHAAEAHSGEVTVRSAKGEGSTFTLTLPIRTEPEPTEAARASNRPPRQRRGAAHKLDDSIKREPL